MTAKDIIIIVVLIIILLLLVKVYQMTKSLSPVTIVRDGNNNKEALSDNKERGERKIKVKVKYNRILKLLRSEEVPMTVDTILSLYNSRHKEVSKGTINSFIRWLEKNDLINSEELESGEVFFGLNEWFTESGELSKEYFKKLT